MKENEEKSEPFTQEPDIALNSKELDSNKKEKIKIFLILSIPVLFIIGLIIIILIITKINPKKENKIIEKRNKIVAIYNIKSTDFQIDLINYLSENINDTIELMKMDNETINKLIYKNIHSLYK